MAVVINQLDVVSEPPAASSAPPVRSGGADLDVKKLAKLVREAARGEARRMRRLTAH